MNAAPQVETVAAPNITSRGVVSDGLIAGFIGAGLVAFWFLVLDLMAGVPFHTPNLLGHILIGGGAEKALASPHINIGIVGAYTLFHVLSFVVVGVLASYVVTMFERKTAAGIALIFLFIVFEIGFLVVSSVLGAKLLGELGAVTVGSSNLIAAVGMAAYLWYRHPYMRENLSHLWDE